MHLFGPNLISRSSKKQSLVARSSAEADYRSMAHTTAEILWIQSHLQELRIPFMTPMLICDNMSAVLLSHNHVLHARTKHMELDIHFVRERVVSKSLVVQHIPGTAQLADSFTKPLPSTWLKISEPNSRCLPLLNPLDFAGGLLVYKVQYLYSICISVRLTVFQLTSLLELVRD